MKTVFVALLTSLVGCAFGQPTLADQGAKERVVYSFNSGTDGENPEANVVDVNGMLYGTTYVGGASGRGTVFVVDPKTRKEKVLYSFCSRQFCADGQYPEAGLTNISGTLYGTTAYGGTHGGGTVFAVDPSTGMETVVYDFCSLTNCPDGEGPTASLLEVNGTLYGTTVGGGAYYFGTVFALDPSTGAETVLYSFCHQQDCPDGAYANSSLIDVNGTLYGTTVDGGTGNYGTVFALDPNTNAETVLYSFCSQPNCSDGQYPYAGLIDVNGTLYGTTIGGGADGGGAAFAVNTSNSAETVLYSFCSQPNCTDGQYPYAGLVDVMGTLYGTTVYGGAACNSQGCGTIFALNPDTGAETVLHAFCSERGCKDGRNPEATLIDAKGTLYGTTYEGGYGYGTVFSLKKYGGP